MIFKLGPKTFTIPSAQIPQLKMPQLKLLTALRIPIPKALKVGGGRAALMSLLVVAGGFGASFALIVSHTNDVPTWPEAGAVYAPTLDWSRINTGCISLAGSVDGHTNAISVDSTIPKLVIDSDRGAGTYVAADSTVDRVIIKTTGGEATIGEILIDDVDASVGAWKWEGIDAGCIVMENTNQFGDGSGINSASAVFNDTVKARVITDNLVDTPISVK